MRYFELRKGLDLPISGAASISEPTPVNVSHAAVLGDDYIGLKPTLNVAEGDTVYAGTAILTNKDNPQCKIVSPIDGTIASINRGARRRLISVIIKSEDHKGTRRNRDRIIAPRTIAELVELLCNTGLWTSFRTRPYSKVPPPDSRPLAIYINAMDTEPLSPDPAQIIAAEPEAFWIGVRTIASLGSFTTYLCANDELILDPARAAIRSTGDVERMKDIRQRLEAIINELNTVEPVMFRGPHPAGLPGTHMHFLEPPSIDRPVWTIGYHDVIVIGRLILKGIYDPSRTIALCGPACEKPRIVRTVAGASLEELFLNEVDDSENLRMISGSVLSGRLGSDVSAFLGRYARQATIIKEDREQIPLGWIRPMPSKYATQPVLGSAFSKKLFQFTSNLNGGRRAMVPTGTFEQLMPQDFLPTQLLRALLVMDTDQAQALGALELDEEDLALLDFACPAKYEYGVALRDCLTKIEKEG